MFQMCSCVPACENISIQEVRDWLEMDKMDVGFKILDDDELVQNVTAVDHIYLNKLAPMKQQM